MRKDLRKSRISSKKDQWMIKEKSLKYQENQEKLENTPTLYQIPFNYSEPLAKLWISYFSLIWKNANLWHMHTFCWIILWMDFYNFPVNTHFNENYYIIKLNLLKFAPFYLFVIHFSFFFEQLKRFPLLLLFFYTNFVSLSWDEYIMLLCSNRFFCFSFMLYTL